MPRKKKEKTASKPVRVSKPASKKLKTPSPVVNKKKSAKPAKKAAKAPVAAKKTTVKKSPAEPKVKAVKAVMKVKPFRVSKTVKSSKSVLDASDPVITNSFKSLVRQGETQLVAFVRDPQCVFTYWEVTPERLESVKRELKEEFKDSYMVLRLYHVDPDGAQILYDEIRVEPQQINRYVELKDTGKIYVLEIGQKTASGRYITYAKSNQLLTGPQTYTDLPHKNQTQIFLEEGMSPDLLNYYQEQGYAPEGLAATENLSSAENLKRLRGINKSSPF
jgi:hypothetical protein